MRDEIKAYGEMAMPQQVNQGQMQHMHRAMQPKTMQPHVNETFAVTAPQTDIDYRTVAAGQSRGPVYQFPA